MKILNAKLQEKVWGWREGRSLCKTQWVMDYFQKILVIFFNFFLIPVKKSNEPFLTRKRETLWETIWKQLNNVFDNFLMIFYWDTNTDRHTDRQKNRREVKPIMSRYSLSLNETKFWSIKMLYHLKCHHLHNKIPFAIFD